MITAISIALALQASGDWRIAGWNDRHMVGVDFATIRTLPENHRRYWSVLATRETIEGADYAVALSEIDCTERRGRTIQTTWYDIDGAVDRSDYRAGDFRYITPGSVFESIADAVCDGTEVTESVDSAHRFATLARALLLAD